MRNQHEGIQFLIALVIVLLIPAGTAAVPVIDGVAIFPGDDIWNVPVDGLPTDPHSADYVATIGSTAHLHPDFGAGLWEGYPMGIPFNIVSSSQPGKTVVFEYSSESDPGPYPVPDNPLMERGPDYHVLILDRDNGILYELYAAEKQPDGSWHAGSGAVFRLGDYTLRPAGWTSADAAGLPILPGLVRYEEVNAGEITHAIRFTAPQTRRAYVWPARHYASTITDTRYPPMGQRFRLRASFDTTGYPPQAKVILDALKKYGMILADNGGAWFITGVPDNRWSNEDLHTLSQLKGSDFEAVDSSSLMIDPNSGRARVDYPVPTTSTSPAPTATGTPAPVVPTITPTVLPTNGPDYSSIQLERGWNFISVPKKLATGSNTAAIFRDVDTGGHSVFQYDGSAQNFVALTLSSPLQPLFGIWIFANTPVRIPLQFDNNPLQSPPARQLDSGWNSIGFTGISPASARNTLLSVREDWATLMGFNASGQLYDNTIFNDPEGGSDLQILYPLKGYWIYMRNQGILAAIG